MLIRAKLLVILLNYHSNSPLWPLISVLACQPEPIQAGQIYLKRWHTLHKEAPNAGWLPLFVRNADLFWNAERQLWNEPLNSRCLKGEGLDAGRLPLQHPRASQHGARGPQRWGGREERADRKSYFPEENWTCSQATALSQRDSISQEKKKKN